MAVDSSALLNGVQPLDIAGAMNKGNQALQGQISTEAMQQEAGDKQVIRDLSSVPGVDFSTPKGIKEFMGHLQGRVAPDTIMKLGDMSVKMQQTEDARVTALSKRSEQERKVYEESADTVNGLLGGVLKEKDPAKQQGMFKTQIAQMREEKLPSGEPVYPAAVLDHLEKAPPSQWEDLYKGSAHAKELSARAKEQAETEKAQALAEESRNRVTNPDMGKQFTSPSNPGKAYFQNKRGQTFELNADTGERNSIAALPTDAQAVGTPASAKAAKAEELLDFTKHPVTPAEEEMARVYRVTRKMESLGQNSPLRPRIALIAAQQAIEEGRNVLGDNVTYKAESANVANLTKQYGVIKAGEQTVLGNLELMKPLAAKVDETGIPVLERWIRAGKKSIEGDEDVTKWNALVVSTQADIGKVLAASTGAGGVPVAALEEAKKYMDGNLTQSQFNALYDIVPKEMAVRTDKMEAQIAGSINKINRLAGSKGTAPTGTANPPTSAPPEVKAADEKLTKQREFEEAQADLARLKAKTNPNAGDIAQAEDAVNRLRKEVARINNAPATETKPLIPDGTEKLSKSGKPMIRVNGQWEYK